MLYKCARRGPKPKRRALAAKARERAQEMMKTHVETSGFLPRLQVRIRHLVALICVCFNWRNPQVSDWSGGGVYGTMVLSVCRNANPPPTK